MVPIIIYGLNKLLIELLKFIAQLATPFPLTPQTPYY